MTDQSEPHRHSASWPRRFDLGDLTALLVGIALGFVGGHL